ncbi:MAG: hypothetical protein AB2718_00425, partial [Candidatus Thiodiazotropha taylori]
MQTLYETDRSLEHSIQPLDCSKQKAADATLCEESDHIIINPATQYDPLNNLNPLKRRSGKPYGVISC